MNGSCHHWTYSGGRGGEGKLLVDDVVLAEGNHEEDAEEASGNSQSDKLPGVLGRSIEESEAIHCRDGTDEQDSQTSRSSGSTEFLSDFILPESKQQLTSGRYSSPWDQRTRQTYGRGYQIQGQRLQWL